LAVVLMMVEMRRSTRVSTFSVRRSISRPR
jgi:hypothetical protein